MFLPYNPNGRRQLVSATPPADDWHAQYGGTIGDPNSMGGGGAAQPTAAGAQAGPYGDARGLTQWDQAGQAGWQDPRISAPAAQPAPPQGGGGFTPLSQIGRGVGRVAGAIGLPWFGGGSKQPAAPSQSAPGPWMPQQGAPGGGGMVLLRAPNGQTRAVPGDQVAHYLARGATRG